MGRSQIARASLEALAFQNRALVDAMVKDTKLSRAQWKVDGGAVSNNLLLQIQADVLNTPMIRPKNLEATATGVGLLALHSLGELSLAEISRLWKQDQIFSPSKERKNLNRLYQSWLDAVVLTPDHSQYL